MSESKIEEIIATLWTILWVLLWSNDAPNWILGLVGIKATGDHIASLVFAICEIREEDRAPARALPTTPPNPSFDEAQA